MKSKSVVVGYNGIGSITGKSSRGPEKKNSTRICETKTEIMIDLDLYLYWYSHTAPIFTS